MKVVINDYSNYDQNRCNNGGGYGFWTTYTKTKDNQYEVSFGCTADMEYCPCCGSFGNHYDYDLDDYICGGFQYISEEELNEIVRNFKTSSSKFIEFK